MTTFRTFEEIEGWQEGRLLRREVSKVAKRPPFSRDLVLRNQICSASNSIMANIAEGFERRSTREFIRFLRYAKGSAAEVRSHLFAALDDGYIQLEEFNALTERAKSVGRLVGKLIAYLAGTLPNPEPGIRRPRKSRNPSNPEPGTRNPEPRKTNEN